MTPGLASASHEAASGAPPTGAPKRHPSPLIHAEPSTAGTSKPASALAAPIQLASKALQSYVEACHLQKPEVHVPP